MDGRGGLFVEVAGGVEGFKHQIICVLLGMISEVLNFCDRVMKETIFLEEYRVGQYLSLVKSSPVRSNDRFLEVTMKEEIRRAVAHAAVNRITGKSNSHIYSYAQGRHSAFSGNGDGGYDHDSSAHVSSNGSGLYHHGVGGHIQLNTNGNSFSGYDHDSGHHFSGTVSGNSVQLYDHGEGRHYNYNA